MYTYERKLVKLLMVIKLEILRERRSNGERRVLQIEDQSEKRSKSKKIIISQ